MFLPTLSVDQNAIKENQNKLSQKWPQHIILQIVEGGRCIS